MKFFVVNFGCKVNTYESTYFEEKLLSDGYLKSASLSDADIIIVNTCSVTNTADSKCKKELRRIKRENPNAIIVATGCSVQNNFDEYKSLGIDILVGNFFKSKIPNLIEEYKNNKNKVELYESNRKQLFDNMFLDKFQSHTRAFIKVQDGCDNFCSYCVIPLVRGSIRSKDFNECVKEAKELAKNGHKEIVLVGIHTGSYNFEGKDLVDLINEISKIDEIKRIRISSIEITELDEKFMEMLKNNQKVVNHLHIPLQTGNDYMLKIMNRKYDTKYFEDTINKIRSIRPKIKITTDVIVGHPYETDELFNETAAFCEKIGFGKIHVFPYSPRKNTKAASMPNQVKDEEKKKRALQLIRISDILSCVYEKNFINQEMQIITETNHQGKTVGFTDNYIKVQLDDNLPPNEIVFVTLIEKQDDYVKGKIIKKGE